MKDIVISRLTKKLIVRSSNKQIVLPPDLQDKIDAYWDSLLQSGKNYRRGEVFTVTKKEVLGDRIEVLVEKTDYAHYLYCQHVDVPGEYGVYIIHTAALVETADGKMVFGKMGGHTARSGIYQLCGGGIDTDDLCGDIFDFDHNIKKELQEELGIDIWDKQKIKLFDLAYFKEGGPTDKMTVVYRVLLNGTSLEFMKEYNDFVSQLQKNGEQPEFSEIILLDKKRQSLSQFFDQNNIKLDEYMRPLFEFIGRELP